MNHVLTWSKLRTTGPEPAGRIGHTVTAVGPTEVLVFGGTQETEGSGSRFLADMHLLDLALRQWQPVPLTGTAPSPRAFHTAVAHDGLLYVFGGCSHTGRYGDLFAITKAGFSRRLTAPGPEPRYCHTAVTFEGGMYVFGGKCGGRASQQRLQDLWCFRFEPAAWARCPSTGDVPAARSAHSAEVCGRHMFVFGGRHTETECSSDLRAYAFDTGLWRHLTYAPQVGRARHSSVAHHGQLVVFGGWDGRSKLGDVAVVEATSGRVRPRAVHGTPGRRECHAAVVVRNLMLVFGGRHRGQLLAGVAALSLGPASLLRRCHTWLLQAGTAAATLSSSLPPETLAELEAWEALVLPPPKAESVEEELPTESEEAAHDAPPTPDVPDEGRPDDAALPRL